MPPPLPDLPLPPNADLWDSCVVRVTAISATTGAVVPGVTVGEVTLGVEQLTGPPLNAENPLLLGINA